MEKSSFLRITNQGRGDNFSYVRRFGIVTLRIFDLKGMELVAVLLCCLWAIVQSAPLPMKMVDLTHKFDNTTQYFPNMRPFNMTVNFSGMARGWNNTASTFWLRVEEFTSGTHVGTHMDSPLHFNRNGWAIDDIPLSRLVAPLAVIDITEKAEENVDYQVTVEDLTKWEKETGQLLNDVIIFMRSGWSNRWGNRTAFTGSRETRNETIMERNLHFPGMSPEAAKWLVDNRKIYGLGTEALSIDHGPSDNFRTHQILMKENIFAFENVGSMADLPLCGATLYALPMKIAGASGAPVRLIATFPEIVFAKPRLRFEGERTFREVIIFHK